MRYFPFASLVLGMACVGAPVRAQDALPSVSSVRRAVERSLPYLEKEGVAWIKERGCHSCHHVPFLLWSFHEARSHGIAVDGKKLAEWTSWSRSQSMGKPSLFRLTARTIAALPADLQAKLQGLLDKPFPKEQPFLDAAAKLLSPDEFSKHEAALLEQASLLKQGGVNGPGAVDVMSPLLLGRDRRDRSDQEARFVQQTADSMLDWQERTGLWSSGNQLYGRRWPRSSAEQATSMWALLALEDYGKADPRTQKSIAALRESLKRGPAEPNLEWLVARLLFEQKSGTPTQTAELQRELRGRQKGDGGWSVLPAGPSDAFSTGQSLYALRLIGAADSDAAVRKAQKYLVDAQLKDGAWPSPAASVSAAKDAAKLKRLDAIYGYWGSAWASIGLSRSLPELIVGQPKKGK
jgi:squalene-hopene/tetraprenyl-beta-curcumene cyclase